MTKKLIAVLAAATLAANATEQIAIPEKWVAQPAVNSSTMPDAKQWKQHFRTPKDVHCIWQKTDFTAPATWKDSRFAIDFQRINGNAIVFIDGKKVGERLGPYGEIDVTNFIVPGKKQELLIFCTRNYTDVSRKMETDPIRNSARGPNALWNSLPMERWALGVNAEVKLKRLPNPAALADAWAVTSFRKKNIEIGLELDAAKKSALTAECDIFDQDGKKVLSIPAKKITADPGKKEFTLSSEWKNPKTWELDGPYLYTAEVKLKDVAGKVIDTEKFRFGFREIWTEGKEIMLNGHPIRFRVEWTSFGLNKNSVSLLKLLGRNMLYFQSNPTAWWRDWQEIPVYSDELLNLCDENGIALLLPIPTVNYARNILNNPQFRKDFKYESETMIKRYRRHPSVIAWCVSMNSFNPRDGIHADALGQRSKYNHVQATAIQYALDQAKKFDPTRLAYGHAEGNIGDLATGNTYPNFTPLQEAEDYGEIWSEKGNMPWWACEFASVYDGSYYKGKQFLLTEYGAIYFGDKAYDRETIPQLEKTIENGIGNRGHGNIAKIRSDAPLYWDVQRIYTENMDRSLRAWGMQGWHYFNFGAGYGDPPAFKTGRYNAFNRYTSMKEPVTKRPEWANPQFDMHAKNMQALLIYIGGFPVHTDKTHAFFAGEKAVKSITTVWDGPGDLSLKANIRLVDAAGKNIFEKNETLNLKNGDIRKFPVEFTAPKVTKRTDYKLVLTVSGWNNKTVADEFSLQVFPKQDPLKLGHTLYVFDPQGKSAWVTALVPAAKQWKTGDKFKSGDILVLGRESLRTGMKLPYSADDIKNGLRVLVLEQKPEMVEAFGFRTIDTAPRIIFPGSNPGKLMENIKPEDLLYWRGKTDLLPEFKHARGYDVTIAPKTTNRHVVASTVIEIPENSSFEPMFATEFDMAYTPLLRWNNGQGYILFNTFDFTNRVGVDPSATALARNLLGYLDTASANAAKTITEKLSGKENPAATILINRGKVQAGTSEFVKKGGTVLNLALSADELRKAGLESTEKKIYRVTPPKDAFAKIAPRNLLRWRDTLTVNAISDSRAECDGIYLERKNGSGKEIFLQVAPELLFGRYKNDPAKTEAVQLSVIRLRQLVNRILTANGAVPSADLATRMTKVERGVAFQDLGTWYVFGPFTGKPGEKPVTMLDKVYPGEQQALEGDTNPNITYKTDDGRMLDFRKTAGSDGNGFVDLGKALATSGENAVAYAVKEVQSNSNRTAMLRLGFDYRAKIYLNGKLVGNYVNGPGGAPNPNKIKLKIDLKKGMNIITLKMSPGSKGFGFWANLSEEGVELKETENEPVKELIYDTEIKVRSPYEYHYW